MIEQRPQDHIERLRHLSSLSEYFATIGEYDPLTTEQEHHLGRLSVRGQESPAEYKTYGPDILDHETPEGIMNMVFRWPQEGEQARQELVMRNLYFGVYAVSRTRRPPGMRLIELVHQANLGMAEAAKRYHPDQTNGGRFVQLAKFWIRLKVDDLLFDEMRQRMNTKPLEAPARDLEGVEFEVDRTYTAQAAETAALNNLEPSDQVSSMARFESLPWWRLDESEADLLHRLFGLGEYTASTANEIAEELQQTPSSIRTKIGDALYKLRSPEEEWVPAVPKLTGREQELMTLFAEKGMTRRQISAALGISYSSTVNMLLNAQAKLDKAAAPVRKEDLVHVPVVTTNHENWTWLDGEQKEILVHLYGLDGMPARTIAEEARSTGKSVRFIGYKKAQALRVLGSLEPPFALRELNAEEEKILALADEGVTTWGIALECDLPRQSVADKIVRLRRRRKRIEEANS